MQSVIPCGVAPDHCFARVQKCAFPPVTHCAYIRILKMGTVHCLLVGNESAEKVAAVMGCQGRFVPDTSTADGIMRKIMEVSKTLKPGCPSRFDLLGGIAVTNDNFKDGS